jgi:hypothetical protein
MILGTYYALDGKPQTIKIPENGKELPFSRYFPAKFMYDQIIDLFVPKDPNYHLYVEEFNLQLEIWNKDEFGETWDRMIFLSVEIQKIQEEHQRNYSELEFFSKVVEFVAFMLGMKPNQLAGFKKGTFKDNIKNLVPIKDQMKWDAIDDSLYMIYGYLGNMLSGINPMTTTEQFEFDYSPEPDNKKIPVKRFYVPKIFGEVDLWNNEPLPDMPTWMGTELCQVELMMSNYMKSITPKGKKVGEIDLENMSEDQQMDYFEHYYSYHLRIMSCLVNEVGKVDTAWMQGQKAIDVMLDRRVQYFAKIDSQTAIDCFFFGLNISKILEPMLISNIGGNPHSLLEMVQKIASIYKKSRPQIKEHSPESDTDLSMNQLLDLTYSKIQDSLHSKQ